MPIFELLAATISFGGTIASVLLALIALRFSQTFDGWRREQRQATTISVLSEYRDRMIVPYDAIDQISPERFSSNESQILAEEAKRKLLSFLNSMEYLALLINGKAIDEDICFRFLRGTVVSSFSRLLAYILAVRERTGNSNLYAEYENLARRWGNDL